VVLHVRTKQFRSVRNDIVFRRAFLRGDCKERRMFSFIERSVHNVSLNFLNFIYTFYKMIIFVTESSENAPPGLQARLIYEIKNENEFVETFELGFVGKQFSCWMTNHWKRKHEW
jgi:hypothetical protein